jgi:hypothetical protein
MTFTNAVARALTNASDRLLRIEQKPPIRFFSAYEEKVLEAVIDRLIPQDVPLLEKRIDLVPVIDDRLYKNALNGFRYEDMLSDRDAYCEGLRAIEEMSRRRFNTRFVDLSGSSQELILNSLRDNEPDPAHEVWKRILVHRFWNMLVRDCADACYARMPRRIFQGHTARLGER